jgi:hypothetical protein
MLRTVPALSSLTFPAYVRGCELARSRAFSYPRRPAFSAVPFATTGLLVAACAAFPGALGVSLDQAANGAAVVLCAVVAKDFIAPKIAGETEYVIVPGIDYCNHSGEPAAEVRKEYFSDSYSLGALRDLRAGDEVSISYGPRSNDQLLQFYGFVLEDNEHDT